jgi:hypothetical protein
MTRVDGLHSNATGSRLLYKNRLMRRAQGVDDLQAGEAPFVFGDNHTIIRFRYGSHDHIERAPRSSSCRTLRHQPRPEQPRFFVEWEYSAGEKRLRALGARKPTLQLPPFLSGRLLQDSAADLRDRQADRNNSSSSCSLIHSTSASDGAGLVALRMMFVSRR